jgi:hypothetical protein
VLRAAAAAAAAAVPGRSSTAGAAIASLPLSRETPAHTQPLGPSLCPVLLLLLLLRPLCLLQAKTMCKSWRYERDVNSPENLYEAQLARRLQLEPAAAPGARR